MKPHTTEWIQKAEADYISALREYRARKQPNHDAACFFAQQCVEKCAKACLQEHTIQFPKTHDLVKLLDMVPSSITLGALRESMAMLSAYAIEFR